MTKRISILGTANDVLPVFLRIIRCNSTVDFSEKMS